MNDLVVHEEYNEFPGIIYYGDKNPALSSPNSLYDIEFYMTKESLLDVDVYKQFLDNAISRFRKTGEYKQYKSYLMSLGLDKCQIFGNIDDEMATVEMHHNFLTIHDIALLITEHVLATVGMISTFDLVQLLIIEHQSNNIPIVMLSKTAHEAYHANKDSFIPPNMTFGKWWELLYRYRFGITIDIAKKVIIFIQRYLNENDCMSIKLRDDIMSFAKYNEYGNNYSSTIYSIQ